MKKCLSMVALILLVSPAFHAQSRGANSGGLKLEYVKDDADCGCGLSFNKADLRDRKYVLRIGSSLHAPAYIKLNGRNIELDFVAESSYPGETKVGDRSWATYAAGNVKLRIEYLVTWVCPPASENCEATYYRAKIIVNRGKQRRVVNGVAVCGC